MNQLQKEDPSTQPFILLIEDEDAITRLFLRTYSEFNLITVPNVSQAFEVLRERGHDIGVLLADHYLPDGTGVEVLAWARQKLPHAVRLLTTSHAHLSQAVAAVNDGGISGYIMKPWLLEELRSKLEQSLQSFSMRQREIELLAGKRETLIALAASIAHEMRTPLATIRMRADAIAKHWPMLMELYHEALHNGRIETPMRQRRLQSMADSFDTIQQEVDRSNMVIDMLLASANAGQIDTSTFAVYGINSCVHEALAHYPFEPGARSLVHFETAPDFEFFGSDVLVMFILYNLLKNALHAVRAAGKGDIHISLQRSIHGNEVHFRDTGLGIAPEAVKRVFDDFYSTKHNGTGVGLSFCRSAMRNMGGDIFCESVQGEYTLFRLRFPDCAHF